MHSSHYPRGHSGDSPAVVGYVFAVKAIWDLIGLGPQIQHLRRKQLQAEARSFGATVQRNQGDALWHPDLRCGAKFRSHGFRIVAFFEV